MKKCSSALEMLVSSRIWFCNPSSFTPICEVFWFFFTSLYNRNLRVWYIGDISCFSPALPKTIHLTDVKIGCDCDGGSNYESPEPESPKEKPDETR